MRKIRGFKIGKRLVKLCRSVSRRRNSLSTYRRLISPAYKAPILNTTKTSLSNWYNWACLKTKAKRFCSIKPGPSSGLGYVPLGHDTMLGKPVPKGHLAVYVGQKSDAGAGDGEFSRVLVPVMYFNHPLFGELLREAEEEFGYHHQGGITIPCRISEFEKVQTTIAAGRSCRRLLTWRRNY